MLGNAARQSISLLLSFSLFAGGLVVIITLDQQEVTDVINNRTALDDAQKEYLRQEKLVASAKALISELDKIQDRTAQFDLVLPKNVEYADLVNNVLNLAKDSNLKASTITFSIGKVSAPPDSSLQTKGYGEITINLALEGQYLAFESFLKKVGENQRLIEVKNLQVTHAQNDILKQQISLVVYYQS